ncbi:MAG: Mov34/MPN/PAD-1 family protein [Ignisphaera sp.]
MKLIIPLKIFKEILEKCSSSDVEKIFIGIGFVEKNRYKVVEVFECGNVSPYPWRRFVANPQCLYNVYRYAENKGMDIVLLVHNHPAQPIPSNEDLKGMRLWRIPWLIIDGLSGSYGAWILVDDEVQEVLVEIT